MQGDGSMDDAGDKKDDDDTDSKDGGKVIHIQSCERITNLIFVHDSSLH